MGGFDIFQPGVPMGQQRNREALSVPDENNPFPVSNAQMDLINGTGRFRVAESEAAARSRETTGYSGRDLAAEKRIESGLFGGYKVDSSADPSKVFGWAANKTVDNRELPPGGSGTADGGTAEKKVDDGNEPGFFERFLKNMGNNDLTKTGQEVKQPGTGTGTADGDPAARTADRSASVEDENIRRMLSNRNKNMVLIDDYAKRNNLDRDTLIKKLNEVSITELADLIVQRELAKSKTAGVGNKNIRDIDPREFDRLNVNPRGAYNPGGINPGIMGASEFSKDIDAGVIDPGSVRLSNYTPPAPRPSDRAAGSRWGDEPNI